MKITSNKEEVQAGVQALRDALTVRAPGRYKTLAEDVQDAVAEGVYDQTVMAQLDPDGAPLAPLAPATLVRKQRLGYPETILVATGQMLSLQEIKGELNVTGDVVEITYGQTAEAREKATYAHEGSRRKPKRPRRPFFAINDRLYETLDHLFDEALGKAAENQGAE